MYGMPQRFDVTTGTPAAIASSMPSGEFSSRETRAKTDAIASSACTPRLSIDPNHVTISAVARRAMRSSTRRW